MSAKPDGGAAFPVPMSEQTMNNQDRAPYQAGMGLRDWFAGQALTRLPFDPSSPHSAQAKQAYAMADAMIAERSK